MPLTSHHLQCSIAFHKVSDGTFQDLSGKVHTVEPLNKGELIVWKSWRQHRVLPVTRGPSSLLLSPSSWCSITLIVVWRQAESCACGRAEAGVCDGILGF